MPWSTAGDRARLPRDWERRKREVFQRPNGHICHVCGEPGANEVDHVGSRYDHSPSNLEPIHAKPCHSRKTARQGNQSERRPKRNRPDDPHPGLIP